MKFVSPNARLSITGTSLRGHISITYQELVKAFGIPNGKIDEYKVDAEWILETPYGVATIYNYKNGRNYLGPQAPKVTDIKDWNVGGKSFSVVNSILSTLGIDQD